MGLRFQRRIGLGRFLRVNVSRGGLSLSAGRPGARVTLGRGGRLRTTVGIPGSGVSWTETDPTPVSFAGHPDDDELRPIEWVIGLLAALLVLAAFVC